ncbi:MAG TPA: hypothetical protein PLF40_33210 [Kofleriaceae bacterium]|nr:hypothetical protein [Kofleriaceae bacterium]
MKIAFALVAMLSTAALARAGQVASASAGGAEQVVPMWQCETNEQTVQVNNCRRQCSVDREAKRPACITTARTCRANCAGDDACRRNCEAAANQCLNDNERNANVCVTNGGCKL